MTFLRMKTRVGTAALAVALAGGLAACGNDDDNSADAAAFTEASQTGGARDEADRYGYLHTGKNRAVFGNDKERGGYDLDTRYCWDNHDVTDEVRHVFSDSKQERLFTQLQQTNEQCAAALDAVILQGYAELGALDTNGDKWIDQDEMTAGLGQAKYFVPAQLDYHDEHMSGVTDAIPVTRPYERHYVADATGTPAPSPRRTATPAPDPQPQQAAPEQDQWPSPPFTAQGGMEWAKKGPFASTYTCGQNQDLTPGINMSECFTGPDGSAYYYFLRQVAR